MSGRFAVVLGLSICFVTSVHARAHAQATAGAADPLAWKGTAALVVTAAILDADARAFAARHRGRPLDAAADVVDPLGRARYIVPSLAGAYVAAVALGGRRWSEPLLRVALGYVAADAVGSVLKPGIGRHRPDTIGSAWRFKPFDRRHEWHSFPSAHTVHAFALAAGVAAEAGRPWVSAVSYGAATLVGLQRVYRGAHWASDVAGSAALAVAAARSANRRLRRRVPAATARRRLEVTIGPVGAFGRLALSR